MRQGSSCGTTEPASRPTYPRSHSGNHSSDIKSCLSDQASVRSRYHPEAAAGLTASEYDVFLKGSKEYRVAFVPSDGSALRPRLENRSIELEATHDKIKTLPTRSKVNSDAHQLQLQSSYATKENRSSLTTQPLIEAFTRKPFLGRPQPEVEVNVARSRCHPRRRACADNVSAVTPKLRRDTDCTDSIVRLIVFFSTKLVHTIWSQASLTPKTSKDFNGAGVLPLQVFIQETLRRSKTSYSTLQVALFYLILLRPYVKPCQNAQQQYASSCRALQCGRRMFLTALILASKYLQDRNYSARAWSKISGLPVAEINENERHYLELIKYNLHMSQETFENWSRVVLTICKTSGRGPFGSKPGSPPSSPDGLSFSAVIDRPGSLNWWTYHLNRLTPEVVKTSHATEQYLVGLKSNAGPLESTVALDTPPSSPESLDEVFVVHSSPLVLPSSASEQSPVTTLDALVGQSSAPVGSIPRRPVLPNLPTPQTTPRHDSASLFSQKPSLSETRHRSSAVSATSIDSKSTAVANLATCPPPRPRGCGNSSAVSHLLKERVEPRLLSWASSPESAFSDSSSCATRSRSSSISSVSSVWSTPSLTAAITDCKQVSLPRTESQPSCATGLPSMRVNVGTYGFYHPVGTSNPIPSNSQDICASESQTLSNDYIPRSYQSYTDMIRYPSTSQPDSVADDPLAELLACLGPERHDAVRTTLDPAVVKISGEYGKSTNVKSGIGPGKKHKRTRSLKEDSLLQDEVREFLWNEQSQVRVEDDKRPATCVETLDKQAQYPLQQWAHAKKPVPNLLHNKRIALQHSSSHERHDASDLATEFLRQSVPVPVM